MARNPYFREYSGEQNVVEDLTIETIQAMGKDMVYIPRTLVNEDKLFGEDTISKFDDGYQLEMYIQSIGTQLGTLMDSPDARKWTAASATTGATAGSFIPIVGTATGAIGGAVAGLVGSMETALTLTELLKTELGDKDFNKENIRAILEDEELFEDIKDRALARGATIGAIEGITAG